MKVARVDVGLLSIASVIAIAFIIPESASTQCVPIQTGGRSNLEQFSFFPTR